MLDADNAKEENKGKRRIRKLHVRVRMSVARWLKSEHPQRYGEIMDPPPPADRTSWMRLCLDLSVLLWPPTCLGVTNSGNSSVPSFALL